MTSCSSVAPPAPPPLIALSWLMVACGEGMGWDMSHPVLSPGVLSPAVCFPLCVSRFPVAHGLLAWLGPGSSSAAAPPPLRSS